MNRISRHKVLLTGDSFDHCSSQVHRFFDLTSLVIYDCIEARPEQSCSGLDAGFTDRIRDAEDRNRQQVRELITELEKTGIRTTADLHAIEQGYVSKTLHILSHFLDGFIGIDSFFYNLLDDSHWLSPRTAAAILANPQRYWLIHVDGYSATPEEAGLLRR
ncbi:MAG: hypothetical protein ACD_75C01596G0002 [uncultured bacterium]|nr:MAG: hypothetical protein ACD_75C01596G0002 [uncultured bacterium]